MLTVHLTKKLTKEVATYKEASEAVRQHWAGAGSTEYYGDRKAGIIEEGGTPVAHVSYNGRVWKGINRFGMSDPEITI